MDNDDESLTYAAFLYALRITRSMIFGIHRISHSAWPRRVALVEFSGEVNA